MKVTRQADGAKWLEGKKKKRKKKPKKLMWQLHLLTHNPLLLAKTLPRSWWRSQKGNWRNKVHISIKNYRVCEKQMLKRQGQVFLLCFFFQMWESEWVTISFCIYITTVSLFFYYLFAFRAYICLQSTNHIYLLRFFLLPLFSGSTIKYALETSHFLGCSMLW